MEKIKTKNLGLSSSSLLASVKYVLVVLELALLLRFLMKLMGADVSSMFTGAVYFGTELFVFPFKNVLESYSFAAMEIEPAVILAGVVYWMATIAFTRFLELRKSSLDCDCGESGKERVEMEEGKAESAV